MSSRKIPLFISIIFAIFFFADFGDAQHLRVGQACRTSGLVSLKGICQLLKNCPAALSNLRSGIDPTLCSSVTNGKAVVCCPTDERISEKKCREYTEIRTYKLRLNPLLPPEFLTTSDDEESSENRGCEVRANSLISGGRNAKENEFPFMVPIGYGDAQDKASWRWGCGGSLISEDFVITAAHCILTSLGRPRRIQAGELYLNHPSNRTRKSLVSIKEIILHPQYKPPSKYNDIALLRLAKKLPLAKSILPICLPQPKDRLEFQGNFSVSGWGLVRFGGGQSNILLTANLQRYDHTACQKLHQTDIERQSFLPQGIARSQVCAKDIITNDTVEKKDTCNGDSGGPLAYTNKQCTTYLIGITSFGDKTCTGSPSVYTNVQSYLDWIEKTVWPNEV